MRSGVRLAVDVGSVRIGVARSDASGTLAVPEVTLDARKAWLEDLVGLVVEYEPLEIIVGLPVSLDGREHAAAQRAREMAAHIAARMPGTPLRLVDERLTTVAATTQLRDAGVSTRKGRAVVDQAAAVIMLQETLDTERVAGEPPGTLLNGSS
ncbi:MAG: Holliday junction resolvase RuvX [Candidatus Nanopelagicales bacterium]|nr:Holliday junction resolvase RuvX [Candidatus Nanopelagicales bacterium]MCU0298164.1 Holliday junction resolvase RuvX [Candidatus Nanopelagicales bacterium]